jgi:hypothetical protein
MDASQNQTTTLTPSDESSIALAQAEIATLNNIYNTMLFYYIIIPTPFGIITNALAIYIFTRKNLNKTTMGFYNVVIAMGNILALVFYVFVQNSTLVFGVNFLTTSDFACRFIYLARRTIREIAPVIETLLTVDRFIEVFFPMKFKFLSKKRNIFFVITGIVLFLVLINFENALYRLNVTVSQQNKTVSTCVATSAVSIASDVLSTLMRTYMPSTVMIVLSTLIIYKLNKSKRATGQKISTSKSSPRNESSKEGDFTRVVVSMNCMFLALNLPECIAYMVKIAYQNIVVGVSSLALARVAFMFNMVYFVATFYYSAFFISNLAFNKIFRKEFVQIFGLGRFARVGDLTNTTERTVRHQTQTAH